MSPMDLINVDVTDGVATITLDDPKRRNAVTLEMCDQLDQAHGRAGGEHLGQLLVITGARPGLLRRGRPDPPGRFGRGGPAGHLRGLPAGRALTRCPSIAAVNGAAVGAGMNLALICDVRLAGRSARFDDRFLNLGIHPGWRPHLDVPEHLPAPRPPWPPSCSPPGHGRRGGGQGRAGLPGLRRRASSSTAAQEMAAKASSVPRELVLKAKQTIQDIALGDQPAGRGRPRARPPGLVDPPAGLPGAAGQAQGQDLVVELSRRSGGPSARPGPNRTGVPISEPAARTSSSRRSSHSSTVMA